MWTPDPSIIITAEQKAEQERAMAGEHIRLAIREHIDQTARSRGYDNGAALASYIASTNPEWVAEAQAFIIWRDAAWLSAQTVLDKIASGLPETSSQENIIAALPPIDWTAQLEHVTRKTEAGISTTPQSPD